MAMSKIPFESLERLPFFNRWQAFRRLVKPSSCKVLDWIVRQDWFTYGDLQDAKLGTEAPRRLRELRKQLELPGWGRSNRRPCRV